MVAVSRWICCQRMSTSSLTHAPSPDRPQKIAFGEMPDMGIRGLLVYCADYRCNHSIAISGDQWSDDLRLSDIEPRFVCRACGKRGADVRPDFNWGKSRPA